MQAFKVVTSIPTPFAHVNVDTDIIIPAQFLKTIKRTGLGVHAFYNIRYNNDGTPKENIFDQPPYDQASILLAGDNFGCGSSREHAPWAIADMGYRCIIAPSFADIFASNCVKNGIVTVVLPASDVDALMQEGREARKITVDLQANTVTTEAGRIYTFDFNPVHQHMLINGLDEIGQTLQSEAAITAFEREQRARTPWLYRD